MTLPRANGVLAIDVGSTSAKLGWFPAPGECASKPAGPGLPIAAPALPEPASVLRLEHAGQAGGWVSGLEAWLDEWPGVTGAPCVASSVHSRAALELFQRLRQLGLPTPTPLSYRDVPIEVRVSEPERVGVDRLLGATAVNRLRSPQARAISVDMGTAITLNLLSADGAFEGGAILPGPGVALSALHAATASLPLLAAPDLAAAYPPVGTTTRQAMEAGAVWGALGAIRELIARLAGDSSQPLELFFTGGGSQHFAPLVEHGGRPARHVPHLVLAGIRLTADRLLAT